MTSKLYRIYTVVERPIITEERMLLSSVQIFLRAVTMWVQWMAFSTPISLSSGSSKLWFKAYTSISPSNLACVMFLTYCFSFGCDCNTCSIQRQGQKMAINGTRHHLHSLQDLVKKNWNWAFRHTKDAITGIYNKQYATCGVWMWTILCFLWLPAIILLSSASVKPLPSITAMRYD